MWVLEKIGKLCIFFNGYLKNKIPDEYLYRQLDDMDIHDPDYYNTNIFVYNEVGDIA